MFRSSYLIIGAQESFLPNLGADYAANISAALPLCKKQPYAVIALPVDSDGTDAIINFIESALATSTTVQLVLVKNKSTAQTLRKILAKTQVFKIINDYNDPRVQEILAEAQEHYAHIEQRRQLFKLLNEQNENLTKLSMELEDRVSKRQQNTIKAREKLLVANQRTEALQRALIALHRAKTVGEIEELIKSAVSEALNVDWVKIDLFPVNPFSQQLISKDTVFTCPLYQGSDQMGQVLFGRTGTKPFSTNQENFLTQVAESISLALFRLNRLKHYEALKSQWESSFDAITRPLSLTNADYNIVRCNRAFAEKANRPITDVIGKKCYQVFFKRSAPCVNCNLGKKFRLPKQLQGIYEVTSQSLFSNTSDKSLYINLYHDITEALNFESQLLNSSREAEVGLIGSSIAHELNNPLAGVLSFVQLIKMDLKGGETYYDDIIEMEKATLRCRDIVANLLGFSRVPTLTESGLIDINEVIRQSKNIFQLRAKSMGIEVMLELPQPPAQIEGQFNLLIQAMGHLMTMAFSTIVEEVMLDKSIKPQLFIRLNVNSDSYVIDFSTALHLKENSINAQAIDISKLKESTSLDLQVTSQIIEDHLGHLDIISLGKFFQARVKFPSPETLPKSQEVDRQI